MKQEQFLNVVSRDEAETRLRAAVDFSPLEAEVCPLGEARGRVSAGEITSPADVPGFARSNMDGFAVIAKSTFGASEETPRRLSLPHAPIAPGVDPSLEIKPGEAVAIATGAVVPRGANAVVMIEHTDVLAGALAVTRPVAPGANISQAASDLARGETVVPAGVLLTSRETGLMAACGIDSVSVVRRPRVALISTGDELVAPGAPRPVGFVFDSNQRALADAIAEAGGEAIEHGIVRDDEAALRQRLDAALSTCDLVLFSGGTSKGAGDVCHAVVREAARMFVHGVALKPGKPLAFAESGGKPIVLLPGFPTSAIFTFHEFVAPWIRERAGRGSLARPTRPATLSRDVGSQRGRREYDLVHLIESDTGLVAHPLGKGSGSVSTFSRADGFYAIPASTELVRGGTPIEVTLLADFEPADLVVMGSHCIGLDRVLTYVRRAGFRTKVVAVGSSGGLAALRRGECDVAGIHLRAPDGSYNTSFLDDDMEFVAGYARKQGVVSRDGTRAGRMVNRNRGSGTRVLIDELLGDERPAGYETEVRSHQAVAAAVASGRADWGVCLEAVASGLPFEFLADEHFDFALARRRRSRPAVAAFVEMLNRADVREELRALGFSTR